MTSQAVWHLQKRGLSPRLLRAWIRIRDPFVKEKEARKREERKKGKKSERYSQWSEIDISVLLKGHLVKAAVFQHFCEQRELIQDNPWISALFQSSYDG